MGSQVLWLLLVLGYGLWGAGWEIVGAHLRDERRWWVVVEQAAWAAIVRWGGALLLWGAIASVNR